MGEPRGRSWDPGEGGGGEASLAHPSLDKILAICASIFNHNYLCSIISVIYLRSSLPSLSPKRAITLV